jgi:hypothetical protein
VTSSAAFRRAVPAIVTLVILAVVAGPPAGAAVPRWHLTTISAPANPPGGEGIVVAEVGDLGDAMVNAEEHPVTIVDTLPAGVSPLKVDGEGEDTENGHNIALSCPFVGQTVTCSFNRRLLPYERLRVVMKVSVTPGQGEGHNEVSVSGGNAPPLFSRRALNLPDAPRPYGVDTYELTPEEEDGAFDTQAGSHPFQLTTTLLLNTSAVHVIRHELPGEPVIAQVQPSGAFTKDLNFALPPGLVGNPTPLPKCPVAVFVRQTKPGSPKCPDDTAVGVATPIVAVSAETSTGSGSPSVFANPLYSLEPSQGEPARFGFQTIAGPVILDTSVRTGGDYAVLVNVSDLPQTAEVIGSEVTFWGVPSDPRHASTRGSCLVHGSRGPSGVGPLEESSCPTTEGQPFLVMPTSCTGQLRTTVAADRWAQPGHFVTKEYAFENGEGEAVSQDGCNRVNFNPSIKVSPDGTQGSSPTGLEVDVHVAQDASLNPLGLAEAAVKDTTVTLPAGVVVNPAAADGLASCGLGEIALESAEEQSCPEASKVGTVKIKTPLLPNELEGAAYLAAQNANPFGSLVALYISVYDPVSGVRVRFAGEVKPDPVTGQLVSTFKNTPQLPFEDLKLQFFGGSRAPLATPAACGAYTTTASFAPWSGNPAANVASPAFNITSGPGGSPCSSPLPFSPSLETGSLNLQAGAFTPLTTTMSREDGQQPLQGIQLHFPPGLSGLLSGVALCGEQQANEGMCGPGSLIGETTVSVGVGGNPFAVKGGRVYITGPYEGAPFGLSIVNPAKAGPFDLGQGACDCVVVRAKVDVDPSTAALTITTDNTGPYRIPTILQGIPLQIKHVNVLITRPGFTINPTNCSKMASTGNLQSTEGASSTISVPFQVTNCATLAFKPKFAVSTSAHSTRANGQSLTARLSYPAGAQGAEANITRVKVDLPIQLPSRLTTLQKACFDKVFNANPAACPPESIVGHATVTTPLLPVPLTGPAYFVSHGGEEFPALTVVLQGYGVTVDLVGSTFINKKGITSTTFKTVPDTPFNTFELTLPKGRFSALGANLPKKAKGSFCGQNLKMPTEFKAQNGLEIHQQTPITVTGCPKAKKAKKAQNANRRNGKGKAKKK